MECVYIKYWEDCVIVKYEGHICEHMKCCSLYEHTSKWKMYRLTQGCDLNKYIEISILSGVRIFHENMIFTFVEPLKPCDVYIITLSAF